MSIKIGKLTGFRGRAVSGDWQVLDNDAADNFTLSVTIHSGLKGDMRVLLAAGPEYPSVVAEQALLELANMINPLQLKGILISVPDFAGKTSVLKGTEKPFYPGWPEGDRGERIAWNIFESLLKQVDYALFLEGANPLINQIPHAALFSIDDPPVISCHPELLKMMGHDLILEKEGAQGTLVIESQRELGLPVLVSQFDDLNESKDSREWLMEKVLNFLTYVGMIDSKPLIPEKTYIATKDSEIHTSCDGIMEFKTRLGEFLTEGDRIGAVEEEGKSEKTPIENLHDGYIVGQRCDGQVARDDLLCSILRVRLSSDDSSTITCHKAIDNREMDVNFRVNRLFRKG
jgi:predicted deacylase